MADSYLSGGQGKDYFFRVVVDTGAYVIKKLDGTTAAEAKTDASLILTETVKTRPAPTDEGLLNGEWDNYQWGADIVAFLNAIAMPTSQQAGLPEWYNQQGVKKGGSAAANNLVLWINYGAYDDVNEKYLVHYALGRIKASSGAHDQKSKDWAKPLISFEGAWCEYDLTIASTLFDDDIITVAQKIISANSCYGREWIAEAA